MKTARDDEEYNDVRGLVARLEDANERYHNGRATTMTDAEFDAQLDRLAALDPRHPLVTGVGAEVGVGRGKDKIRLPYVMGSLDKIRYGETERLAAWKARVARDKRSASAVAVIVSDKLDGVSAMVTEKRNKKMFTRGDGVVGRDVSHLLSAVHVPDYEHEAVRGELIVPKSSFAAVGATSGQHARNIVAGVVNAVTPNLEVLHHVEFVAYEVVAPAGMPPHRQFSALSSRPTNKTNDHDGVVHHTVLPDFGGREDDQEKLARILEERKTKGRYAVDGVVVALRDVPYTRTGTVNKGSLNYTNAFAFKDGRGDASFAGDKNVAEVEVERVEWNANKDGLLKPVVVFVTPVDLGGASVRRATGFNADFVVRNGVGRGAKVSVTRSGEVIPHILNVTRRTKPHLLLPDDVSFVWTPSGKDIARVVDAEGVGDENDADVRVRRLVHFARVMGMEGLRGRTLYRLFHEGGLTTAGKLVRATSEELAAVPGIGPRQAENIHASIRVASESANCLRVMHASNAFGQGFGERKLRDLTAAAFPDASARGDLCSAAAAAAENVGKKEEIRDVLLRHPGVQSTTADAFVAGLAAFGRFQRHNAIPCHENKQRRRKRTTDTVPIRKDLEGQSFVFSGFRDAELEKRLRDRGADVKSNVSRTTTALVVPDGFAEDGDSSTGKVEAAKRHGVPLRTKSETP